MFSENGERSLLEKFKTRPLLLHFKRILIPNSIPDQHQTMNFSSSPSPSLPPRPPPLFLPWLLSNSGHCHPDLGIFLLSAPFFMRYVIGGRGWEFGSAFCKLIHYLCSVNMYASIFLIATMSLDRFLAVSRPFLSQRLRTKRSLLKILLVIWSLAFLFAIPMPFYRRVFRKGGLFYCIPFHSDPNHMIFQYLMETLFGFLIPFAIIIFCYSQVGCRLQGAKFNKRRRSGRLILLIVVAFAVFWMPYHIVNLIQVSGALAGEESLKKALLDAAKTARPNVTAFAFFSSSINPILYVFAGSSHIRSTGLNFMAKMFEGTHSGGSGSSRVSRSTKTSRNYSLDLENLPEMKPLPT
ncbi:leukotriene B4 receptor 1-like [Huso huso]|uniref:Leukotriene B4 receptor 1-like n=1 Tax=Huso huso TaxID=61971 RepID=A0ABR0Y5Q8_HUSHU